MTNLEIVNAIIEREGGFVDHPADKGGPTKFGITLQTLSSWRKRMVSVAEVEQLSVGDARDIYLSRYITEPGFDAIKDDNLRHLVIDCGVNHGTGQATKMLQRALSVKDDGIFGADTKAALETTQQRRIYYRVVAQRARFYGKIITGNPSQAVFAAGWLNRGVAEFIEDVAV